MTENEKSAWCRVFFTSLQGSAGANPWVASHQDQTVFDQHAEDVIRSACLIADRSVRALQQRGILKPTTPKDSIGE